MSFEDVEIIMPKKIYIAFTKKAIPVEYNIYFHNIILNRPLNSFIDVECEFGKQYEKFWRFEADDNNLPKTNFPLTISVKDERGIIIAIKTTEVLVVKTVNTNKFSLMCIGDSMTRAHIYVSHLVSVLPNIQMVGTRTYDNIIFTEGRGGWSVDNYLTRYKLCFGVSPFLFPVGIDGNKYYGNTEFWKIALHEKRKDYEFEGFQLLGDDIYNEMGEPKNPQNGDVISDADGVFKRYENGKWVMLENQQFEFDFSKYILKNKIDVPDIVSLLFGANDFQFTKTEEIKDELEKYFEGMDTIIESIKDFNADVKIIVNMPVVGASQDAWGICKGCEGSAFQYNYNMKIVAKYILDKWDNDESHQKGIYVSPMLIGIDVDYGFDNQLQCANKYSTKLVAYQNNWVHPNECGYKQMGDVLLGVVQNIREEG